MLYDSKSLKCVTIKQSMHIITASPQPRYICVSGAAPSAAQYWHALRQEVEKVRKWSEEAFCPRRL